MLSNIGWDLVCMNAGTSWGFQPSQLLDKEQLQSGKSFGGSCNNFTLTTTAASNWGWIAISKLAFIEPNGGGVQSFEEGEILSQAQRWAFTEVRMFFRVEEGPGFRLNIAMHKLIPSQPNLIQGNKSRDLKVMCTAFLGIPSTRWSRSKAFVQTTMGWEPKTEECLPSLEEYSKWIFFF